MKKYATQLQIQYFQAAVSENRNLKLKFAEFAYHVDSWLMSCLSVPYSLLVTATNKYLETEKWRFYGK